MACEDARKTDPASFEFSLNLQWEGGLSAVTEKRTGADSLASEPSSRSQTRSLWVLLERATETKDLGLLQAIRSKNI